MIKPNTFQPERVYAISRVHKHCPHCKQRLMSSELAIICGDLLEWSRSWSGQTKALVRWGDFNEVWCENVFETYAQAERQMKLDEAFDLNDTC